MVRALFASIVATAVTAGLLLVDARPDVVPELNALSEIAAFNARLGLPADAQAVWTTHAVVGVLIYGLAYAFLEPVLPGPGVVRGALFGVLAFLVMVLSVMPLIGRPLFAQHLEPVAIATLFAVHIAYGLVLGLTYGGRSREETPAG